VLTIQGKEAFILKPADPVDLELLIDALCRERDPTDLVCVIGDLGPVAPPQMCNGLQLPIAYFDQLFSFPKQTLIESIPRPEKISAKDFAPATKELFNRIMRITWNDGTSNRARGLNFLALRYDAIYAKVAEAFAQDDSLTGVRVVPSRLSDAGDILDFVFSFTNRKTGVTQMFSVSLNVAGKGIYLVAPLAPYYPVS